MPRDRGSAKGIGLASARGPLPRPLPAQTTRGEGRIRWRAKGFVGIRKGPHPRPESRTLSRKRERG
jgi:hypothetical protein